MDLDREIAFTRLLLAVTVVAAIMTYVHIAAIVADDLIAGNRAGVAGQIVFALVVAVLFHNYCVYLVTRAGQLRRQRDHVAAGREELESIFDGVAPALAVLVPSYKEETAVVYRTLMSAGLQDYPRRRVVLLIDDPPRASDPDDLANLATMRQLPRKLQALFDPPAARCDEIKRQFVDRCASSAFDGRKEAALLAEAYAEVSAWFDREIANHRVTDHADTVFVSKVLQRCREAYCDRAVRLTRIASGEGLGPAAAQREFARLATLFRVEFTSFERKLYENLSHQANKAMNLNSYLGLMGRCFRQERVGPGLLLRETPPGPDTFDVPDADLVLTLDADSVIVPEYALRLSHVLRQPGNSRVAVVQTPYSAFPGAPGVLERIAGATTDIQYLMHQGFTSFNATFWVGANALLRKSALEEIVTESEERGYAVRKYIQDRTVIEDTESSIDLADRGWTLFNYPERMAYSATPADFGSLLIQRRRWANGGLLILPKALRHLARGPQAWRKLPEGFLRVHYLTSIAVGNLALLTILFGVFERDMRNGWLIAGSLPYVVAYARDLVLCGYRSSDFLRIYALNVLLLPVHLGGVLKSLHQAITGRRTPFGRTPKVIGRTAAPTGYVLAEYAFCTAALAMIALNVVHRDWLSALFALTNFLLCFFAILRFIGLRNSAEDLGLVVRPQLREREATLSAPAAAKSFGALQPVRAQRGMLRAFAGTGQRTGKPFDDKISSARSPVGSTDDLASPVARTTRR